ncbi:MAG: RNA polymerase factor sigma-32 [Alphaproteobacteria bacterium]|nr:RNA polymerase factor sigma-32 [Alphaproteobacteria bacterium]
MTKGLVLYKQTLPFAPDSAGLAGYLSKISKIPMLEPQQEHQLAMRAWGGNDHKAAEILVLSHLRLAAKIALQYRRYKLPVADLIAEANIGLIQAVRKFDPNKGFRLATYAMWWIRASLNQFVLNSWSLLKVGTSAAQKKLFYNLQKIKAKLGAYDQKSLDDSQVAAICADLNVRPADVRDMEMRMQGDASLNDIVHDGEGRDCERQAFIADQSAGQEETIAVAQEKSGIAKAMSMLSKRERQVLQARYLDESDATLEQLGARLGVSRERVRQIEAKALEKMKALLA